MVMDGRGRGPHSMGCFYIQLSTTFTPCLDDGNMAKAISVLRCVFGFFNLLFAIAGLAVIIVTIILHIRISKVQEFQNVDAVYSLYVIGFITLGISFLGAYGAFRKVKWMLILFLVLMVLGLSILVFFEVVLVLFQHWVLQVVEEALHGLAPLDAISEESQTLFAKFQQDVECCGLFKGYEDWGEHVPPSCDCTSGGHNCVAMPQNTDDQTLPFQHERSVYSQTCGSLLLDWMKILYSSVMGFVFVMIALTFLGVAFSSCLVDNIRRRG
ncbi:tetraspanin-8-like isoform X2 [Engraulis encrasicolus]|uniref:tetraspanin-8-like isoform X2 n=1 Tax=Engraulis encrasicolus TaxID=184585 RepID=UPI002FD215CC